MRDTDYAFCVAKLRANERYMLTSDDYDSIIEAKNYQQALEILIDKGFISASGSVREITDEQNSKLWSLLESSVPSKKELDVLCLLNDFFNIKAAVKCYFADQDANNYFIRPTTLDLQKLIKAINEHDFSLLGGVRADCAKQAYKSACTSGNGQNAEIIIDRAAICVLMELSKKSKYDITRDVCSFLCDTANIKIALRCQKAGKNEDFIEAAIGECVYIDRRKLVACCKSEQQVLIDYLKSTKYTHAINVYEKSVAEFDKWCELQILKICADAKYTAFGFDPVCAFYYKKLNEIKNVRIILTCKQAGIEAQEIRKRVRIANA